MAHSLIAQRYAKALFELGLEMNVIEELKTDMELIRSVCVSNKDFRTLLKSPILRPDKKLKVLNAVFKDQIGELSMRYLALITRKRREILLFDIVNEFIIIYKEFKNIFTVHFHSAREISDDIRKEVIALLEKQTGGSIELIEEVKEDLVGGFVMNWDDYKYDASISYQLRKIRKEAAEINLYIKGI